MYLTLKQDLAETTLIALPAAVPDPRAPVLLAPLHLTLERLAAVLEEPEVTTTEEQTTPAIHPLPLLPPLPLRPLLLVAITSVLKTRAMARASNCKSQTINTDTLSICQKTNTTYSITGLCSSDADCASGCCAGPKGACSARAVAFDSGKTGCGFGGAGANNNAGTNNAAAPPAAAAPVRNDNVGSQNKGNGQGKQL